MKTEDEARKLWCPFARVVSENSSVDPETPPHNRYIEYMCETVDAHRGCGANCIASQCMAWRPAANQRPERGPRGFCGLAGKPS